MAREGYYLFQGDKTACGGKIIEGAEDTIFNGRALALEGHAVTCGKHPGRFRICGGMGDTHETGGMYASGLALSTVTVPARVNHGLSLWMKRTPTNTTAMRVWRQTGPEQQNAKQHRESSPNNTPGQQRNHNRRKNRALMPDSLLSLTVVQRKAGGVCYLPDNRQQERRRSFLPSMSAVRNIRQALSCCLSTRTNRTMNR